MHEIIGRSLDLDDRKLPGAELPGAGRENRR
jgi:hypothetical protein